MTESEFLALAESTLDRIEGCLDKLNDDVEQLRQATAEAKRYRDM